MKIIIVGCGKVGYTIAKYLSEEDNDVVMIDTKLDSFNKILESLDVMVVKGNGLSAKTLEEANIREADMAICVTSSDETNILCCMTAKRLGAKHVIARVRDPEYALELDHLKNDLGLDMIINPEQQAALEIARLVRFPTATGIETFVGGRVESVSFRVTEENPLAHKTVVQSFAKRKADVLLISVERKGGVFVPHGDMELLPDDIVRVLGQPKAVSEFFKELGIVHSKVKDAMIIGGGRITRYLARILANDNMEIKILEIDEDKCVYLSEELPDAVVIQGDGTDEDVLRSEDISRAGVVICLTDRDEENLVVALYSRQCGVQKTILKVNHINLELVKNLGFDSVICPKNITAYKIIRYVRGLKNSVGRSQIQTMYKIAETGDDRIEALEFRIASAERCLHTPLKSLRLKEGVLVGCIVRKGGVIIPSGATELHEGDSVIVVAKNEELVTLDSILAE